MIGIDLIALQTASRVRGIGKYTLALIRELDRLAGPDIVYWWHRGLPRPNFEFVPKGQLVDVLPQGLDWLLLTSPFEGGAKYQIPAAGRARKMAAILYDFIPLMWPDLYLRGPVGQHYNEQLGRLLEYDKFLAISDAVKSDAESRLAVNPDKVTAIGAGLFPHVIQASRQPRPLPLGLDRRQFVLSILTSEPHKNAAGLVTAFSKVDIRFRSNLWLVIVTTSEEKSFVDAQRAAAAASLPVLFLVGQPDEVVARLYNRCRLFCMPSHYEGFGLPALEAMACGAPVVAGKNSAQVEVVGDAGLLVDTSDTTAMSNALTQVLADPAEEARLRTAGPGRAALFRWEDVAARVMAAIGGG